MNTTKCLHCGKKLNPDKMVWLELDNNRNVYTAKGVPEQDSQGWFEFGAACAKKVQDKPAEFSAQY